MVRFRVRDGCEPIADHMDSLLLLTIAEASQLIAAKSISPVELVNAFLQRIEAVDDRLNSYILVGAEAARASAKIAEAEILRGDWRGPLHGIPYAVKDNYFTAGLRTCANSRLLIDHVPSFDATAVVRLNAAGAVLLGKLNTWEFGTGTAPYFDLPFPEPRNPWNLEHFAGGSSTGAGAAVAARTTMFALGADTMGSVRLPAAACGVQGLKPTYGRTSRFGILPNCWSLDVSGVLGWTADDCAHVLQAIAGSDENDPASSAQAVPDYAQRLGLDADDLTIGIVPDLIGDSRLDPANAAGMRDMIAALTARGCRVVERRLPAKPEDYWQTGMIINCGESFSIHEQDFLSRSAAMGTALREKMMMGFGLRAADYLAAQRHRRKLAKATDEALRGVDALLLPCAFHTAPRLDDAGKVAEFTIDSVTGAFSLSGHPALSCRTGFASNGLPTNAQLVGHWFDEATILRVASAYENATLWREQRPVP